MGFNPAAYNAEELFLKFTDELIDALDFEGLPPGPWSLLMDVFAGHTTSAVLRKLRDLNITPSLIPGGCTGLLQPLDTAVNKPLKVCLRDFRDAYLFRGQGESERGC